MGPVEAECRGIRFQYFQIETQETPFFRNGYGGFQERFAIAAAAVLRRNGDVGNIGGVRLVIIHIAGTQAYQSVGIPHLDGSGILPDFLRIFYEIDAVYMDLAICKMGIDKVCRYLIRQKAERGNGHWQGKIFNAIHYDSTTLMSEL